MGRPARYEIEKFAKDRFAIARDRILKEYAEERNQVLAQVRLTGNSGGYLPALTTWGAERVREEILALADAYVEAFTLHGVPSDARTETDLKAAAEQMAAGTISAIRGELDLMNTRTRKPRNDPGGHLNREIEAAMKSALKEGVLGLRRQRITPKNSESRSPAMPSPQQTATVVFGSNRPVIVVRNAGTAEELQWDTLAGGDFVKLLLFHTQDRVTTGDEVRCELFDEPRVIFRVDPHVGREGVAYWEAGIMPRSEWNRLHPALMLRDWEAQGPQASHKTKKPARRSKKYEGIDKALCEIADARPKSHEEVFQLLNEREVPIPSRRPFKSAGGWLKGYEQDPHSASVWLSQAWGRLTLPAFARGPKK